MKIAVLGAGAMGSLYGTYLSRAHEVTMLDAYQPQVDAINAKGITMLDREGQETNVRVKAVPSGADIGAQDLVVVFVKSTQTYEAMKENQRLIGPHTVVMTLQNGAGNNRDIANFIDPDRIIVGTSSHNSVGQGLGRFYHSGNGPTNIGPNVPGAQADAAVERVAEALRACGLEVNVIENIQRILWSKLFVNCGLNGLTCMLNCRLQEMLENDALWDLCRRIVYECVMVAEADGTYFERREALEIVRQVAVKDATGLASMVQDRRNRRRTEIDKINGTVVRLAEQYHLDAPYNRMLVEMVHAVEQNYPRAE
ncbi:MAG: 2-dehydropantoate 2-reductase [Clostridia bacterium]|nr:2-dehydropantoate 2-reductase [Clostridia bacterium]